VSIEELRFLVVEDQGFQRWVVGNMLEKLGAKYVFSAGDGKAALEMLAGLDAPVDIVITDVDMPGMDGLEFIRHLADGGGEVSVVLVSGLESSLIASIENMARAYRVNLLGSIQKPASAKKLQALIDAHGAPAPRAERAPAAAFNADDIALAIKRWEFEPFFQPKVDLRTREVKGAEATVRWRHPERGIVAPSAFIDLLEKSGGMRQVTDEVLRAAAFNCRLWRNAGSEMTVSVNLTLGLLSDVSLADRMLALVDREGLEPRHVIFEVTESTAVSDLGKTLENLSRLRMKGFGLSIDDYGTGYSSMQRLSRVPFTELKIDQTFVRNAIAQPASRAMVESSLEMARKLKIAAVAEGVETQAEWDLVRELGCDLAQGYFIGKPMDAAEFIAWVRQRRALTV
jgi:EAL domain-containing protein (putative c-di-GMP-specific phosphodiesterase class I)/FixJ family two-component response regulator